MSEHSAQATDITLFQLVKFINDHNQRLIPNAFQKQDMKIARRSYGKNFQIQINQRKSASICGSNPHTL